MVDEQGWSYRSFWTQLLEKARSRTDLHARTSPGNDWWISAASRGIAYNYALRKDAAYVELWIDKGNEQTNEAIFLDLQAHKAEIEKAFGAPLKWHRARGRSRALQFFPTNYGFDDRGRWPEIQDALIDAMIRLEAACQPRLQPGRPMTQIAAPPSTEREPAVSDGTLKVTPTFARDFVTLTNLRAGIAEFRRRWPGESDFHNGLYAELETLRQAGRLTWGRMVAELSAWKALRTPIPGRDKYWYLEHGEQPFGKMLVMAKEIRAAHEGQDPDLLETTPGELMPLFETARAIKGADSPMFASKLCHFLMPRAFPIADQAVLGIGTEDYWHYWQRCADGWRGSAEREALRAELRRAMGVTPIPSYPWAAKITELCQIGSRR